MNDHGVTITLAQIYEKLENIEKSHNELLTQLKVQAGDNADLKRRVDRLERHEWWLITTVIGTVIASIIGAFFTFAQIGRG